MRDYVAIFDIGSNAVRLVVYDGLTRAPVKIHNERAMCGLGADLGVTGRLNAEAVEKAFAALRRYAGLVSALGIRHVYAVATAALRDSGDGPAFIEKVRREFGLDIEIIGGEEEARLSAQGVMANGLGQDGIIGDYGGGSLELVAVAGGRVTDSASLPLGSHRLHHLQTRAQKVKFIDAELDGLSPALLSKGGDFYALGGAWRSMARAHMFFTKYPLRVLDHYEIGGKKALEFAALLSRQSQGSLEKTVGLSKRRVRDVSVAALVMERVFERIRPRRLVFSGAGLREGLLFDLLPPAVRKQDALLAGAGAFSSRTARFSDPKAARALFEWVRPLFAEEDAKTLRLVEAACILSDTAGFEHEDFQADHAFRQVLVLPLPAIDHAGRAFLAIVQHVRYKGYLRRARRGQEGEETLLHAQKILGHAGVALAARTGLALRLAWLLCAGATALLARTGLKVTPKKLTLGLKGGAGELMAETTRDALSDLAAAMDREPAVEF